MPPEVEGTENPQQRQKRWRGRGEGIRGRGQAGGAGCLLVCVPLQVVGTSRPLFLLRLSTSYRKE